MGDHADPRDKYWNVDQQNSPLAASDRDRIQDAVIDLIKGCESEVDLCLDDSHPTLSNLYMVSHDSDIDFSLYVREGELDMDITANERFHDDGTATVNGDPHYLRDLGDAWEVLEADLIEQAVRLLDLPEYRDELESHVLAADEFGFLCTSAGGLWASFDESFAIPAIIKELARDTDVTTRPAHN